MTTTTPTETFRITKPQCREIQELAWALDALYQLLDRNEDTIACLLRPIQKDLLHLAGNLDLDSRRIDAPGTKKGGAHGR